MITAPCSQTIVGRIRPNRMHFAYIGGDCLLWTMGTCHNWKALNIMGEDILNFRLNMLKYWCFMTMSMFPYHTWFFFRTPPTVQFWMQIKTQHTRNTTYIFETIKGHLFQRAFLLWIFVLEKYFYLHIFVLNTIKAHVRPLPGQYPIL